MTNDFTLNPVRGDIIVGDLSTQEIKYIAQSDFAQNDLPAANYEVIGVVAKVRKNCILGVYKNNASKKWLSRWQWKLTGYTLDGTNRTGTLSLSQSTSNYNAAAFVISYNASTKQELVNAINNTLHSDAGLVSQDFHAFIDSNDNIMIQCNCNSYDQYSKSSASAGFTLSHADVTDVTSLTTKRCMHGGDTTAISSLYKAASYYRASGSNPSSPVTSVRTGPVKLEAYTSSENCALLRNTYGEGEEGWMLYLRSFMLVDDIDWGLNGQRDGLERTKRLALKTYTSNTKTSPTPLSPAANYCYNIGTVCAPAGTWFLPTMVDLSDILGDITYGTDSNWVNTDPLNAGLNKISGKTLISNSSHWWSCLRYDSGIAWYANGNFGYFSNYYFYSFNSSFGCVPVSLFKLPSGNS